MSCDWVLTHRSIASLPRLTRSSSSFPAAHHLRVHEHGPERGAQLVRERGEELVLGAVGVARLGVEPRVLEGEGGLLGETLREQHLLLPEQPAPAIAERQHADHALVRQEGDREHGPVWQALEQGALLTRQGDARVAQEIRRRDRPPLAHGEPDGGRARRQPRAGLESGNRRAGARDDRHLQRRWIDATEERGAETEQPAHRLRDPPPHHLRVEGLVQEPADLRHRLRGTQPRLALAIEPRVVDGDGGAPGDVLGQRHVLRRVAAARAGGHERDRPERALARDERHHEV